MSGPDMTYGHQRKVDLAIEAAVDAVKLRLAEEGFGILTEVDIRAKLLEKAGEDIGPYVMLGACSPPDALRAIQAEPDIGLLLPCNVVIRKDGEDVLVSSILPAVAMGFIENSRLHDIAMQIQARLIAAVERV